MNKFNVASKKVVIIGVVVALLSIYPVCRGVHFIKHHKIVNIKKYKIVKNAPQTHNVPCAIMDMN